MGLLIIFVGVMIPLLLTTGPISQMLRHSHFGAKGVKAIDIIIWVPVLIILGCCLKAENTCPTTPPAGRASLSPWPKVFNVAPIIMFAMCGSEALSSIGFGHDVSVFMNALGLSKVLTILLLVVVVECVVGP